VRRRLAYEADPAGFGLSWAGTDAELAVRIAAARERLPHVVLGDAALLQIAHVCAAFDVDGMRADLVTARTAVALAAWHDRTDVTAEDVRQAALLALPHRRRRNPFDAPGLDEQALDDALAEAEADAAAEAEAENGPDDDPGPPEGPGGGAPTDDTGPPPSAEPDPGADDPPPGAADPQPDPRQDAPPGPGAAPEQAPVAAADPYRTRLFTVPGIGTGALGRRSAAETTQGRTVRARTPRGRLHGLHFAATLRAAAPHQRARGRTGAGLVLHTDDLREAVKRGREGNLVLFAVDASGSMAARQRMGAVKGAVLSLLFDAYQRRDKVGLVTFRGRGAELALPPTSSVEAAVARLDALPTGGRTPLAAGLLKAADVLRIERLRDPARRALLIVVTDGRATQGVGAKADPVDDARAAARFLAATGVAAIVVDCENGHIRLGLAGTLAGDLGGVAVRLDELSADGLSGLVRTVRKAA
jgi:magnesium chelatase subunit D